MSFEDPYDFSEEEIGEVVERMRDGERPGDLIDEYEESLVSRAVARESRTDTDE